MLNTASIFIQYMYTFHSFRFKFFLFLACPKNLVNFNVAYSFT